MGEQCVHGEAHDNAGDGQRVEHLILHQQIGAPIHRHDQHLQPCAPRVAQGMVVGEHLATCKHRQGADHDLAIQAQHEHFTGADTGPVATQRGKNRRRLAFGHGPFEREIGSQPVQAVLQATPAQVKQAFEDLTAGLQLDLRLVFHGAGSSGLDGEVSGGDDDQQQQRQHPGDAGLERVAPPHCSALWQRSPLSAITSFCHVHSLRQLTWRQKNIYFSRIFGFSRLAGSGLECTQ
ncbi:hypothetical protein PS683_05598 [Pseudomonas fluorescens]|uniref:Uncharacterized protein n=1 Tax=Pseudomonas fluorescens TaxID=294 RepID=A0A5E6N0I2_PSEFL|nr:hypothetical protein PS683_05598 [Pseudomonas fluorescens]VVN42713.1 hypothetical protein PS683_05598 [Pseudomonas fluorescens]